MTRSVLQPLRTRRVADTAKSLRHETNTPVAELTPSTRQTLAAIGALWVSFAVTSSGKSMAARAPLKEEGRPGDDANCPREEFAGEEAAAPVRQASVTSLPR